MKKRIEEECMRAINEFYCNNNYDFFDVLEDKIIYFSPGKDHFIQGKEEVCEYFKSLKNNLRFETGNAHAKLIYLKPGVFMIHTDLELRIIHENGKEKIINQRIVSAFRQIKRDGIMLDACPYIQVSNLLKSNAENKTIGFTYQEPLFEYNIKKMIPLPGENGTLYYINTESVKYVESLKGVKSLIHTDFEDFTSNRLIKDVTQLLGDGFMRCHSGYTVNIRRIKSVSPYKITLNTNEEIPVPVKKYTSIKNLISDLL